MKTIDDLIRRYDHASTDVIALHTQAKLKMIKALLSEIEGSKDCAYMWEIVSQFAEILEDMQEIIDSQMFEIAKADGYGPTSQNFMMVDAIPENPEAERSKEFPSCLPPEGGFQTDEQVKKAFTNYLTYHVNRKTKAGKDKPFSIHTIYDYSSRLKVLWEIVYEEWQTNSQENRIQLNPQAILPGCTFLNAFHNVDALKKYVEMKDTEVREIAMGLRDPIPAEKAQKNPLNNLRNLANTNAALTKFEEFKTNIDKKRM